MHGIAMMLIGRYGDHFLTTLVLGSWMNNWSSYSVQVKASNREGATNERSITVIIMLATKKD